MISYGLYVMVRYGCFNRTNHYKIPQECTYNPWNSNISQQRCITIIKYRHKQRRWHKYGKIKQKIAKVIEDFLDSPQGVNGEDDIHFKNTLSQICFVHCPKCGKPWYKQDFQRTSTPSKGKNTINSTKFKG